MQDDVLNPELQSIIDRLQAQMDACLDQFEARVWRVSAIVAGLMTAVLLTALAVAVAVLIAVLG